MLSPIFQITQITAGKRDQAFVKLSVYLFRKGERNIFKRSHCGVWKVNNDTDPKSELRITAALSTHWELLIGSSKTS